MISGKNNRIIYIDGDTLGGVIGGVEAIIYEKSTMIYIYDNDLSTERGFYHSIPDIRIVK